MERAMSNAELEAKARGHSFIGTEHVLLALVSDDHGVARNVLDQLGVTIEVKKRIEAEMDSERYRPASRDLL
ncbi:MAG: Clp amino terminal domain, pathogenicity island component [Thermoleophilaceae bacterium]|jgi:ATP-dependent Clp protease ATP-binding subunit ClpA|nr:Clp amino terminal domain, pathogenicity island component [Thermoleophilaceae bacterium]